MTADEHLKNLQTFYRETGKILEAIDKSNYKKKLEKDRDKIWPPLWVTKEFEQSFWSDFPMMNVFDNSFYLWIDITNWEELGETYSSVNIPKEFYEMTEEEIIDYCNKYEEKEN